MLRLCQTPTRISQSAVGLLQSRGVGGGAAATCNWITNAAVSQTFLTLIQHLGGSGTFWLYAVIALAGAVWVYFTLPETNGKEWTPHIQSCTTMHNDQKAHCLPIGLLEVISHCWQESQCVLSDMPGPKLHLAQGNHRPSILETLSITAVQAASAMCPCSCQAQTDLRLAKASRCIS